MSDGVYDMPEEPRRTRRTPGGRPRALLPTIATLIVLLILFSVFTDVWTQRLWYRSIDFAAASAALGAWSRRVATLEELEVAVKEARGLDVPAVIEVPIDPAEYRAQAG